MNLPLSLYKASDRGGVKKCIYLSYIKKATVKGSFFEEALIIDQ